MVLYFIQRTKTNKGTKSATHDKEGKNGEHDSLSSYSKYENRDTNFCAKETKGQFNREREHNRNATHLGASAHEDSGHLPIVLLVSPEAAGLVKKGADLCDCAAITRGDWCPALNPSQISNHRGQGVSSRSQLQACS